MRSAIAIVAAGAAGLLIGSTVSQAGSPPPPHQQATLAGYSVLPSATVRPGSPPSGAFFGAGDRATATANGLTVPATGPAFADQPVQGISALVPAGGGAWWALADNGYGARNNSADWQLALYKLDLRFGRTGGPRVLDSVVFSDPSRKVPWQTVCDPTHGTPLPPLSFNVLPSTPPAACGTDPSARLLTGADFDPESIEIGKDGTLWVGDEFGPFLLHFDRAGRLLEAPIPVPGLKAPQNPTLDVLGGERPTVASSRGFEDMAITPNRERLYVMTEGATGTDDPQDLRIRTFNISKRHWTDETYKVRLEMPGAKVDLSSLTLTDGSKAYPGTVPPTGTGGESAAELTALDNHRFLVVERDSNGDGVTAPRFKKVFVLDTTGSSERDGYVDKQPLVDLMAVSDPNRLGGDGDFFRFPFNTIEAVHVVDDHTILVANDNNYPFSNARSRSRTNERTGPLAPDDNEFILVKVSASLHPNRRLLPTGQPRGMRPVHVEQSRAIPVPVDDAFRITLALPLPELFRRWHGPIPPIKAVHDQDGEWATVGQTRTIALTGGGTMREELTRIDPPLSFGYRLTDVTGALGPLVDHVDGEWAFAPAGTGTEVTWRWTLHPKSAATRPGLVALGKLWPGYARKALAELSDHLLRPSG